MIREMIAALLFFSPLQAAEPVALFNERDLEGWTFDTLNSSVTKPESVWSVSDGILICKGRPPGVIRTLKEFSNYDLTLDWRWAPGAKPGNSGVLIHCSKPREAFVWPKSVEVQLGHGNAGDFWMIGEELQVPGSEPQGRRWVKSGSNSEKPSGEWNTVRIRCEGEKVSVWVNGQPVNQGTHLTAKKGAIALQSEGHEVHFRKIRLTPIE